MERLANAYTQANVPKMSLLHGGGGGGGDGVVVVVTGVVGLSHH